MKKLQFAIAVPLVLGLGLACLGEAPSSAKEGTADSGQASRAQAAVPAPKPKMAVAHAPMTGGSSTLVSEDNCIGCHNPRSGRLSLADFDASHPTRTPTSPKR